MVSDSASDSVSPPLPPVSPSARLALLRGCDAYVLGGGGGGGALPRSPRSPHDHHHHHHRPADDKLQREKQGRGALVYELYQSGFSGASGGGGGEGRGSFSPAEVLVPLLTCLGSCGLLSQLRSVCWKDLRPAARRAHKTADHKEEADLFTRAYPRAMKGLGRDKKAKAKLMK